MTVRHTAIPSGDQVALKVADGSCLKFPCRHWPEGAAPPQHVLPWCYWRYCFLLAHVDVSPFIQCSALSLSVSLYKTPARPQGAQSYYDVKLAGGYNDSPNKSLSQTP